MPPCPGTKHEITMKTLTMVAGEKQVLGVAVDSRRVPDSVRFSQADSQCSRGPLYPHPDSGNTVARGEGDKRP